TSMQVSAYPDGTAAYAFALYNFEVETAPDVIRAGNTSTTEQATPPLQTIPNGPANLIDADEPAVAALPDHSSYVAFRRYQNFTTAGDVRNQAGYVQRFDASGNYAGDGVQHRAGTSASIHQG